jgi:hypothetical protein
MVRLRLPLTLGARLPLGGSEIRTRYGQERRELLLVLL